MKKILVIAGTMLFGFINANAAGTLAGTVVTNNASLTYSVGGTPITTAVISGDDVFVVDDKVDLLVTNQGIKDGVTPGSSDNAVEFSVKNEGNKVHDFLLIPNQNNGNPFGVTDTIEVTITGIFVESGTTLGYQAGEDIATFIDELAPDAFKTVYIVSSIPNTAVINDVAEVTLTAQAADGGAIGTQGGVSAEDTGLDDAGDVQIVWGDGAGSNGAPDVPSSGTHGDTSAYKVQTATLLLSKTSCVVSDPFNGTTNPKRIPGAVIRYAFEVENTGNKEAATVVLTDDIQAILDASAGDPVYTDLATNFRINDGACGDCVTGGSTAAGGGSGYVSPNATLDFGTVDADGGASDIKCGYFDVTISAS